MNKKIEKTKGYMLAYGNAFRLSIEVIETLFILAENPKWYNKPETAIRMAIKKLEDFRPEFQKELIERAIAGNYQGLVFGNSKEEELKYYGTTKDTKLDRLARLIG